MVLFQISSAKEFMNRLLLRECFDSFQLYEASITTYNTFSIDGRLHPEFFADDAEKKSAIAGRDYSLWCEARPLCLEIIKGRNTPLNFKIVLKFSEDGTLKLLEEAGLELPQDNAVGLYLSIRFSGEGITVTTGTSFKSFTVNKEIERAWDRKAAALLTEYGIDFAVPG